MASVMKINSGVSALAKELSSIRQHAERGNLERLILLPIRSALLTPFQSYLDKILQDFVKSVALLPLTKIDVGTIRALSSAMEVNLLQSSSRFDSRSNSDEPNTLFFP